MKKKSVAKRIISIFLVAVLCVNPVKIQATQTQSSNFSKSYSLDGTQQDNIVAVAQAQVGKTKAQLGYTEAWCADFVSDCAKLAGLSNIIPFDGYCQTLYQKIKNAGGVDVSTPQKGDIVFYYCKSCSVHWCHVGLMIDSQKSIEGNYNGKVSVVNGVYTDGSGHSLANGYVIRKYVRPAYSNNTTDNIPQGSFDGAAGGAGTVSVSGWAFDRDNLSRSLSIHVYIGGPAGSGAPCHIIKANKERTDVGTAYPGVGNYHGYNETITTDKTGTQEIYVYAINEENGNNNPLLGHKTVTIEKASRPQMKIWFSDTKMGEQPDTYSKGKMYYLCYEVIDGNTGKTLAGIEDMNFTVTETIYKPNGSVAHTYNYTNDNNWIGHTPTEEGTYKGVVKISGDLNGEVATEFSISHVHSYVGKVTKAATCKNTGVKTYTCSCGASYTTTLAKTAHQHTQVKNAQKATCLKAGYTGDTYCTDCNTLIQAGTSIAKLSHTTAKDAAVAPTCTQIGKTEGSHCSVCGTVIKAQQTVAATGHTWDSGKVTKQATAMESGVLTYTCTKCKVTKTEPIPVLGVVEDTENTTPTTPSESEEETDADSEENYEDSEDEADQELLEVGDIVLDVEGIAEYEVIAVNGDEVYVEYTEPTNRKAKTITIPDSIETEDGVECKVTAIASGAFRNNKNVKKIVIGNNVTAIGSKAFYGCKSLASINLGNNVKIIGSNAFSNCSKLTKLVIPSKVTKIGSNAFSGCKNIKTLVIKSKKLTSKGVSRKAFKNLPATVQVQVPTGKLKAYKKLLRQRGLNTKAKMTDK